MSEPPYEFQLEAQTFPVPPKTLETAMMILNDKDATLRERLLAACIVDVANALNNMIVSLDSGTVTLRIYENKIVRDPGKHPRRP